MAEYISWWTDGRVSSHYYYEERIPSTPYQKAYDGALGQVPVTIVYGKEWEQVHPNNWEQIPVTIGWARSKFPLLLGGRGASSLTSCPPGTGATPGTSPPRQSTSRPPSPRSCTQQQSCWITTTTTTTTCLTTRPSVAESTSPWLC